MLNANNPHAAENIVRYNFKVRLALMLPSPIFISGCTFKILTDVCVTDYRGVCPTVQRKITI